ncbi:MAG TPA: type I restriction enzyme HsdR N-terminal domain-containing protein [Myxococcota bacterium]|nr:type I restriction enzyme HsdR N-terminal domain-containing protein [Myxococcota bacterium]HRY96796.1 type I restriction enzyme HsdR N-terminal domain-containing protein [Myxococcota bacterium]
MMPKKVAERLVRNVAKFQQVLKIAKDRDVNESDTVSIIKDMLAEVFGYDKYVDVTSEFAIRGTFCDLAIKIDNKVEFLIEAKAIGLELKDSHLKQAIDYGANNGAPWVILTNGVDWRLYKVKFEQPINYDFVCSYNFMDLDTKNEEHLEKLFLVCKEGLVKAAREEFHERMLTVNRFVIGALVLTDDVVGAIRRELRKVSDGVLVAPEAILAILKSEVLKRDVLEGEEAEAAQTRVKRYYGKAARRQRDSGSKANQVPSHDESPEQANAGLSPEAASSSDPGNKVDGT